MKMLPPENHAQLDRISMADVSRLLPDKPVLHVTHINPDKESPPVLSEMSRAFVYARLQSNGAYHTGPNARMASHGICSPEQDGRLMFVETIREVPAEPHS